MTGQRMSPEREAEMRAWQDSLRIHDGYAIRELFEELEAVRAHAQQVEVLHSSAAVLGYTIAQESGYDSAVGWEVIDDHQEVVQLGTFEQSDDAGLWNCFRVAVVRVGPDGRIGGTP